jgi:hypothetical protein
VPVVAEQDDLFAVQFTVESSSYLRVAVAVETEDCEVLGIVMARVTINVVNLNRTRAAISGGISVRLMTVQAPDK